MLLPLLFATFTMPPNPALSALRVLLANNSAQHSIKTGALTPASAFTGFHNHLAYYVTALYRLGASADELSAAYAHASVGMLPPAPRRGLVNASTWEERVGSCGCGLVSGRTDLDYLDYYDFYKASMSAHGVNATLSAYWPRLAAGLGGDIFHAVIQLGYAFESGDLDEMTAQGLAWCSTAYAVLPGPTSTSPPPLRMTPAAALSALQHDPYPFPHYAQQDDPHGPAGRCQTVRANDPHGNVCWNDAVEDLVADHSTALLRYELDWGWLASGVVGGGEEGEGKTAEDDVALQQLCRAALLAFAAGGYDDFYLLHLVTGSRGVWAVANMLGWWNTSLSVAQAATKRDMLTALWRAMLYAFVVKLRPDVTTPPALAPPWRPWSRLAAGARNFTETHLAKVRRENVLSMSAASPDSCYCYDLRTYLCLLLLRVLYMHCSLLLLSFFLLCSARWCSHVATSTSDGVMIYIGRSPIVSWHCTRVVVNSSID